MNNIWKRSLSLILAIVMVVGMVPFHALRVEAAEADGWYWDGDTLYIKNGSITKGKLYSALVEKYGNASYKYAASKPSWGWGTGGTEVKSGETGSVIVSRGAAAAAKKTGYTWTGAGTENFTVEYYYVPSVTVSGKAGVTATVTGVSNNKAIYGAEFKVTLPAMGEDGWVATIPGLEDPVELNANEPTEVWARTVDAADDVVVNIVLSKAEDLYKVSVDVNPDTSWGTAIVDLNEGASGTTVTITATPNGDGGEYAYYVEKIEVNGTEIEGNTFQIGEENANVVVTFGRFKPEMKINGYHTATDYSARFESVKAKILSAVLRDGYASEDDYNLHIWSDPIAGDAQYFNWDDTSLTGDHNKLTVINASRFPCADFGDNKFETNLKVKIIDKDGRTVETTIKVTDSRTQAVLDDYVVPGVTEYDNKTALDATVLALAQSNTEINKNGVPVTVSTNSEWPNVAGVDTKMVYTVTCANSAEYIGDTATITVTIKTKHSNCTITADDALNAGGSLTVPNTIPGNTEIEVSVTPNGDNVVETISVYKNGELEKTYTTNEISYNNKKGTIKFITDGSTGADAYVVSATYSQNFLTLNDGATIIYCVDDEDHEYDLQKLVFEAIFGGSSAPMNVGNVTLEYSYIGVGSVNLWQDISKGPTVNLGSLTHKFGEKGSETIRLKYSDAKYGSFEQQVTLNVFDSCYNVEVAVQTVTNNVEATIKTQFSGESKDYMGVKYFKSGTDLTITLTPDGEILDVLGQLYNGTYSDSMAYIKDVRVYERGNETPINVTVTRDSGKLELGSILQGVNPMLYNASVTFTLEHDKDYFVVVEYDVLKLEMAEDETQMNMYKGGKGYAAEVPSAQEIVNEFLGEEYAANFIATNGGAWTVEFSTDLISYSWTEVSDEALLALEDNKTVGIRVTWKPADNEKKYYPVAVTGKLTLTDPRTATSVAGEIPTEKVEYVEEAQLKANLIEAMGLGILANGELLNVEFDVNYTIEVVEAKDNFATVIVTYHGSEAYKPCTETFEMVPIADIPDNATVEVSAENVAVIVTNNAGVAQNPENGLYTVIGNGTYNFKFTPASGYAIDSVTVDGNAVELAYNKGVVTFSLSLTEKEHYEIVVETVASVWNLDDERVYDFAVGITTPDNENIVDAAVNTPDADEIDYSKVTVEYLARAEGKVTVSLPDINLGFINIPLGTFDIDLGELWLNPEESVELVPEDQLDKLLDALLDDVIDKVSHGELSVSNVTTYIQDYVRNLPLGIHSFGANGDGSTETVRFSYADDKYTLAQVVTDVTIYDYRTPTELVANDCELTFGYSLEQLIEASGAIVTAEGVEIDGLKIETKDLYLHANAEAQQITLTFAGDVDYQPSKVTINAIVNKATCELSYDSQMITYGDEYDLGLGVNPSTMPDGTTPDIDRIEIMIGLDAAKMLDVDISDKTVGLDQVIAFIQLRLPQSIRDLPLVGESLQGEFTLTEFTDLVNSLSDILGIDEGSMEILNQVVEAITGITDRMDIKVRIKDEEFHPKNMGVYIAGAVTVDSDFETAYTADYLIIAPKTQQAELAWDHTIQDGILFLAEYNQIKDEMCAHVVETEELTGSQLDKANAAVKYLVLGINDETSEFLTTDIYGNIKANIWTTTDAINDNGAYVQIAYLFNWGNEMFYAMPLVRSFVIAPETAKVEFIDADGSVNPEQIFTFDNGEQKMDVRVTVDGEVITPAEGALTYWYVGVQSNGKLYNSHEHPVHAGIYAVTATYLTKDENGGLENVGIVIGAMIIEPAASSIEVTGTAAPGVIFDAKEHGVATGDVTVTVNGQGTADYTLISGFVGLEGNVAEIGLDAIVAKANIDFPAWLDQALAEYKDSAEGVNVAALMEYLRANGEELIAKAPAEELAGLGIDLEEITDKLNAYIDELLNQLDQLPENITLTFEDQIGYTECGVYFYCGIVTDSDHYPSVDTGLMVIEPSEELVVNIEDTIVHYDGLNHMPEFVVIGSGETVEAEMIYVIIDQNNTVSLVLEDGAKAILDLILEKLGKTEVADFPSLGEVEIALDELYADVKAQAAANDTVNKLVNALGITEDDVDGVIYSVKAAVVEKLKELNFAPETTLIIDGEKPVEVGTYRIYALAIPKNYTPVTAEGSLMIENGPMDEGVVTIAPTCTEPGLMTYTCIHCGEVTETEEIPALGHTEGEAVVENEVAGDCTNDVSYDSVVYCSVCGEELSRETVTVDSVGHTAGEAVKENETETSYESVVYCSVCGAELSRETVANGPTVDENLSFYKVSLSLQDYIGLQFILKNADINGGTYDKIYLKYVQKLPEKPTVPTDAEQVVYGTAEFKVVGNFVRAEVPIMSWSMSDEITATVFYEVDGVIYQGPTVTTSVREQAQIRLGDSEVPADQKEVCVAMLNYGAAVQVAFEHCHSKEEYLANSVLTPEQRAIPEVEFGNHANVILPAGDLKPFRDSLNMQAKVVIQLPVKITDFSAYDVRYTIDGGAEITLSDADITKTVSGSTIYRVPNIAVVALNMRSEYRVSFYNKGTNEKVYGDIVCSVADIAAKYENHATYHNVAATMLAYGDAVVNAFGG